MQMQFKCKNCGADMSFDPKSLSLKCPNCGQEEALGKDAKEIGEYRDVEEHVEHHTYKDQEGQQQYICQNCGAEIVTNDDTTATSCSFCGSPVVLSDKLTGSYAPTKVVPFKITKKEASEAFKKWSSKLLFAPNDFKKDMRVRELTGIYVPYWLYDEASQGEVLAHATKTVSHRRGDDEIIETMHYEVYRKIDVSYKRIPADASEKMADDLMDKLEPYDYKELFDFDKPYLAGYLAEKYNYTSDDIFPRIKKRVEDYTDDYIRSTMHGYSTVDIKNRAYNITTTGCDYTLMPVWMVYSKYNKGEYTFAMNGQTGKIAGDPPIDKGKVSGMFAGIAVGIFFILRLITVIVGGPIL